MYITSPSSLSIRLSHARGEGGFKRHQQLNQLIKFSSAATTGLLMIAVLIAALLGLCVASAVAVAAAEKRRRRRRRVGGAGDDDAAVSAGLSQGIIGQGNGVNSACIRSASSGPSGNTLLRRS